MLVVGRTEAVDTAAVRVPRVGEPSGIGQHARAAPVRGEDHQAVRGLAQDRACRRATTAGAPGTGGISGREDHRVAPPPTRALTSARLVADRVVCRDVGDPLAVGRPRRRVLVARVAAERHGGATRNRGDPETRPAGSVLRTGFRARWNASRLPSGENASAPTASDAPPSKSASRHQRLLQVALFVLQPDLQVAGPIGDDRRTACSPATRPDRTRCACC